MKEPASLTSFIGPDHRSEAHGCLVGLTCEPSDRPSGNVTRVQISRGVQGGRAPRPYSLREQRWQPSSVSGRAPVDVTPGKALVARRLLSNTTAPEGKAPLLDAATALR